MLFTVEGRGSKLCDGLRRREFLRAGAISLFGASLGSTTPPSSLAASTRTLAPKAKSCILLFLMGGPPQHSTWDPKPDAADEIRGALRPIATATPGTHFCELLTGSARLSERIAILRAVTTGDHAHSSSGYAMLTGQPHQPLNFENANPGPPNDWPTMGAVVQHLRGGQNLLPTAIRLPHRIFNTDQSVWPGQDSGFLGPVADPWLFRCEPASADAPAPEFTLPADVPLARLEGRRRLLGQLDEQLAALNKSPALAAFDQRRMQAFDLLSSPQAFTACDLTLEPPHSRDRYGRGQFGQSVLLARRLVEAGVAFVQVNWFRGADEPSEAPCWDSHANETSRLKNVLLPPMDQAFSTLLDDLEQRGILDQTLVICMGEFGRTPKFNAQAGRDHWGHVFSLALAGGGIRGGVVHGASDHHGAYPLEGIVRPEDLTATVFHLLGHSPESEIRDRLGRPLPLSRGRVIHEVLA